MKKVYCERNAWRPELRRLSDEGKLEVVHCPYEGHNRRVQRRATPSKVTADCTYFTADSADLISEMVPSGLFEDIKRIIGGEEFDARHIDSAYKTGCDAFLSKDKQDIVNRREQLESLLGVRFFHPHDDWDEFLEFLG